MMRLKLTLAIVLAWSSVAVAHIDPRKVVDLTHPFDETTIYWPTAKPFRLQKENWGRTPGGWFYAAGSYAASEHGGTHLDSPIHFAEGRWTADAIPLDRLIGRVAVIDVSAACAKDRDHAVTPDEIITWEKTHGAISSGTIVVIRTGWGRFYPDKRRYLGDDTPGDASKLHFPGLSRGAADLLIKRKVSGVGIDTASLDPGPSKDFIAHQILNGANIYGLENLANVDKLPPTGATIIALPMKIKGGSGGPTRIIALVP